MSERADAPVSGSHAAQGPTLGSAEVARVAELLELFAELPSTPSLVAGEARYRAAELASALPTPPARHEAGSPQATGPVQLAEVAVTGIAGLLELLSGLPSTPPDVADDAQRAADSLWETRTAG